MKINYNDINDNKSFELINIKDEHKKEFFKEHRHKFYELIFITNGYGKHSIDFKEYELKKDLVYLISPSQVHKWLLDDFNNEYDGYIFLFSRDFFQNDEVINNLFDINIDSAINICNNTKQNLTSLVKMIEDEYKINDDYQLISHLFSSFLKYIFKSKKRIEKSSNIDERVGQLRLLIEQNYKKEKSAGFYANKLDITTKRLNEIMQQNINQTVTCLINERVMIEAKRELIYSKMSIKEISEIIGFFDSSYFSRFFKKQTGISPLEFRERHIQN